MNRRLKLIAAFAVTLTLAGCDGLPIDRGTQGTILGGATGAALGSMFGSGSGRVVATGLGAVVGSIAGSNIAERNR
jgi:outer membrane lipoprotein SlyB